MRWNEEEGDKDKDGDEDGDGYGTEMKMKTEAALVDRKFHPSAFCSALLCSAT